MDSRSTGALTLFTVSLFANTLLTPVCQHWSPACYSLSPLIAVTVLTVSLFAVREHFNNCNGAKLSKKGPSFQTPTKPKGPSFQTPTKPPAPMSARRSLFPTLYHSATHSATLLALCHSSLVLYHSFRALSRSVSLSRMSVYNECEYSATLSHTLSPFPSFVKPTRGMTHHAEAEAATNKARQSVGAVGCQVVVADYGLCRFRQLGLEQNAWNMERTVCLPRG